MNPTCEFPVRRPPDPVEASFVTKCERYICASWRTHYGVRLVDPNRVEYNPNDLTLQSLLATTGSWDRLIAIKQLTRICLCGAEMNEDHIRPIPKEVSEDEDPDLFDDDSVGSSGSL